MELSKIVSHLPSLLAVLMLVSTGSHTLNR
jgi:hypothetical protein